MFDILNKTITFASVKITHGNIAKQFQTFATMKTKITIKYNTMDSSNRESHCFYVNNISFDEILAWVNKHLHNIYNVECFAYGKFLFSL